MRAVHMHQQPMGGTRTHTPAHASINNAQAYVFRNHIHLIMINVLFGGCNVELL